MGWSLPQGFMEYVEMKQKDNRSISPSQLQAVLNEQSIESDCHRKSFGEGDEFVDELNKP